MLVEYFALIKRKARRPTLRVLIGRCNCPLGVPLARSGLLPGPRFLRPGPRKGADSSARAQGYRTAQAQGADTVRKGDRGVEAGQ